MSFDMMKKPLFRVTSAEKSTFSPAESTSALPLAQEAEAGELKLEEAASGGLGRHLGLFSTTFLVYVRPPCLTDVANDKQNRPYHWHWHLLNSLFSR